MKKILSTTALLSAIIILASCGEKVYHATDFGILPGTGKDVTASVNQALEKIKTECNGRKARLVFEKGEYDFFPNKGNEREYYISNHDQDNPKQVAVAIEGMKNFTLDGSGADFYMNGRMLPVSMESTSTCPWTLSLMQKAVPPCLLAVQSIIRWRMKSSSGTSSRRCIEIWQNGVPGQPKCWSFIWLEIPLMQTRK